MYVHSNFRRGFLPKLSLVILLLFISCAKIPDQQFFKIKVIDADTGSGIPMVTLSPLTRAKYITDSNGYIAMNEPSLMGKSIYFQVKSDGYSYPMGADGRHAVTLDCVAGDSATVKMNRINVAERLYRATGADIYKDSYELGEHVPIKNPMLNANIFGQDSNLATLYQGNIFWIWGDSFLPHQYHGNFAVAGATSRFPSKGGLDPNIGVNYDYILDENGSTKPMINLEKLGYVWFDWIMNIQHEGKETLVAKYANVNSHFANYERGIAVFNDEKQVFESIKQIDEWMPYPHNCNHPFKGKEKGEEYFYLTSEFNFQRVLPVLDSLIKPTAYESFTCLKPGTKFDLNNLQLDRDAAGKLIYDWKKNTDFIDLRRQNKLVDLGEINKSEGWIQLRDVNTGEIISDAGKGSVFWNEYRQKWVLISGKKNIWYAEADTPVGPWTYARNVACHKSFLYNPTQHPFFDEEGGKSIFFEGTFTKFMSQEEIVPKYDYNQLMYKLSLENEQVFLPSPVYKTDNRYFQNESEENFNSKQIDTVSFYAMQKDRAVKALIPVFQNDNSELQLKTESENKPLFYALPANHKFENAFLGKWETKINFEAFDNSFHLSINNESGTYTAKSDKSNFEISNLLLKNDALSLTITHPEGVYTLKGKVLNGYILGNWTKKDSRLTGSWDAIFVGKKWWAQYSPDVVSLYEFNNKKTGEFFYVTVTGKLEKDWERSSKPLCKVWVNPSDLVVTDFKTKPVKMFPNIY